jgi:hypothetical protein
MLPCKSINANRYGTSEVTEDNPEYGTRERSALTVDRSADTLSDRFEALLESVFIDFCRPCISASPADPAEIALEAAVTASACALGVFAVAEIFATSAWLQLSDIGFVFVSIFMAVPREFIVDFRISVSRHHYL